MCASVDIALHLQEEHASGFRVLSLTRALSQLPEAHPDPQRAPAHGHAASLLWPPRPLPHQPAGLRGQTLALPGAVA